MSTGAALIIEGERDGKGPAQRVGDVGTACFVDIAVVDEELRETTDAIAAHLSKGAVGVDVVHVTSALFALGGANEHDAIGSDAEMAIADESDLV